MRKHLFLMVLLFLNTFIFCQEYQLIRGSLNNGGGIISNSRYTSSVTIGEVVQGEINSANNSGFIGFLHPVLGQFPPRITSVGDVPADQGRKVQVTWNKSSYDEEYAIQTFYSVWRQDEIFRNSRETLSGKNSFLLDSPFEISNHLEKIGQKRVVMIRDEYVWTFIDTVHAVQHSKYSAIVPTLLDSSAVSVNLATFKVIFHGMTDFYESEPESGYSTDNISPNAAENITIVYDDTSRNPSVIISWDEVTEGTYQGNSYPEINGIWYKIYMSDVADFKCGESNYLDTVQTTQMTFNINPVVFQRAFFKIIVSDQP